MKDTRIIARISQEDKDLIEKAASLSKNFTASKIMVRGAIKEAKKIIKQYENIEKDK